MAARKMNFSRRSLLVGAGASIIAAPSIVRAASLMPVKVVGEGYYTFTCVGALNPGAVWRVYVGGLGLASVSIGGATAKKISDGVWEVIVPPWPTETASLQSPA